LHVMTRSVRLVELPLLPRRRQPERQQVGRRKGEDGGQTLDRLGLRDACAHLERHHVSRLHCCQRRHLADAQAVLDPALRDDCGELGRHHGSVGTP
jgi:hypothetical protein